MGSSVEDVFQSWPNKNIENKFYFQGKNWELFILILLSLEKVFIVLLFKNILDSKLNFYMHLKKRMSIVNNGIALLKKLRYLYLGSLCFEYIWHFWRPHLHYCDVIYDKPRNE